MMDNTVNNGVNGGTTGLSSLTGFGRGRGLLSSTSSHSSTAAPPPLRRPVVTSSGRPTPPASSQYSQAGQTATTQTVNIDGASGHSTADIGVDIGGIRGSNTVDIGGGGDSVVSPRVLPLSRLLHSSSSSPIDQLSNDLSRHTISSGDNGGGGGDTARSSPPVLSSSLNVTATEFIPRARSGDIQDTSVMTLIRQFDDPFGRYLYTEIDEPMNQYQDMVYHNIYFVLYTMSSNPASYETLAPMLIDNAAEWHQTGTIDCNIIVNFLLNQVAVNPDFRYTCAKLCQKFSVKLSNKIPTFRDVLLTRCQYLFGAFKELSSSLQPVSPASSSSSSANVEDSVRCCGELLLLLCELSLQVRPMDSARCFTVLLTSVLSAVDILLQRITQSRVQYALMALKLMRLELSSCSQCNLSATMTRVTAAAVDTRLTEQLRQQLNQLVSQHTAHTSSQYNSATVDTSSSFTNGSAENDRAHEDQYSSDMDQFEQYVSALELNDEDCGQHEENDVEDDEVDAAYEEFLMNLNNK